MVAPEAAETLRAFLVEQGTRLRLALPRAITVVLEVRVLRPLVLVAVAELGLWAAMVPAFLPEEVVPGEMDPNLR
jgi:hypothetical protein